jgi:fucose permease
VCNIFINFVSAPEIGNLTHEHASHYLFLLWGGMMLGRFIGSYLMRYFSAERVLAAASIGAFVVMTITMLAHGSVAMWALISVGLFHSIMFPTIFTLGIRGLGPLTEEGSGILIMAIAGGALVVVQGTLADWYGLQVHSLSLRPAKFTSCSMHCGEAIPHMRWPMSSSLSKQSVGLQLGMRYRMIYPACLTRSGRRDQFATP